MGRGAMRRVWAAFWLALALVTPATGEPARDVAVQVTPEIARQMARRALETGQPRLAADIAAQLLAQSPDDPTALVLQTAGLARSGRAAAAVPFGKRAFRLAPDRDARFEAAFLTAEALSLADRPMAAKLWLRRASGYTVEGGQDALLRDAYAKLNARTPLTFGFALGAGPSNNVNGGSLHDTFWVWGIPIPIDEALPGFAASGQVKLGYRLAQTDRLSLNLYAKASHREVWLSEQAKLLNPGAKSSDYASNGLDLGLSAMGLWGKDLRWSLEAQAGQRWYAHGTTSHSERLALGLEKSLAGKRMLAFSLEGEATGYPSRPVADTVKLSGEVSLWQPLGKGSWGVHLGYSDVASDAAGLAWRGASAGVEWRPAPVMKEVGLSVFGTVQVKDYWKTPMDADLSVDLGSSARFPSLAVMGFAPTATLTASRNMSDLVVRDSFDLSLMLGLASTF